MGESINLVTYSDVFHFFNIRETHFPNIEIGKIPQNLLDQYNLIEFSNLRATALRGYNKCLEFRSKVVIPSEIKDEIKKIKIHSKYCKNDTLAEKIKEMWIHKSNKSKPVKEKVDLSKKFHDQFYIPRTKTDKITYETSFGIKRKD
ncbi:hypothetical protein HERIO_884 [Hepatospora eriocheir]|uniref:Uncharacterized protein n=1 Tax=Hepatospora eriocheir TaxID=1081669 RepID=A0A1X0QBX0_9MICR|nr:hypothetical protein HERIO_884 [Hepatospora eriocheir]